ncbi:MAG TPA: putative porin, partial [Geobacteraceae bacterium]|nr:putative porin [Geobacteraceae bacterium]
MKFRHTMAVGLTAFTFLAGSAQTSLAEQARAGEQSAVSELLRLLESKGVLSKEEAGALEKKFTGRPTALTGAEKSESRVPVSGAAKPTSTTFYYEEVRETLAVLVEEGVISAGEVVELEERAEMIRRAGRGETVPERQPLRVGVVPVEPQLAFLQVEEVRERLRLLAYQKVMTRDEAAQVYKRFGDNYTSVQAAQKEAPSIAAETKSAGQAVAAAEPGGGGASVAGVNIAENVVAPFAYGEVVETVETLNDQGIISDDEMDELKGRVDDRKKQSIGEKTPERRVRSVGVVMIPYRRTTAPLDDVQDNLKFLAYQKIMSPQEASNIYARFSRKYPTDQLAENISDELAWEVRYQVDQKMQSVSDVERKQARLPEWVERFTLSGDIRLRYQGEFFDSNNLSARQPSDPSEFMNTTGNRSLFRLRARLGVEAKVSEGVTAGLRLATGSSDNPVSTNVTLGDFFNRKNFQLDLGYLKWSPQCPAVTLWGGRFPNPWFFSDLVWDTDLNFDGFAVQYKPKVSDSWGLFFTA